MKHFRIFLTLCVMLVKRLIKNPIFVISLLAIPILAFTLNTTSDTDESILKIGLYAEDAKENTLASYIIDEFAKNEEKTFSFKKYTSKEKLKKDILKDNLTCGIILCENLEISLLEFSDGVYKNEKSKNCPVILMHRDVYTHSANLTLCKEAFFSKIYNYYSEAVMLVFAKNTLNLSPEELQKLRALRADQDVIENFFDFKYANGVKNEILSSDVVKSYLLLPLRGLICTLILLCGLCGGILYLHDEEQGFFKNVRYKRKYLYNLAYVSVPTMLSAIIGLFGIFLGDISEGTIKEIATMAMYSFVVMLVCFLIIKITKSLNLYVSILPLYIISNIIICPIFINIADYLPIFKYIRYFLPVYYGLLS